MVPPIRQRTLLPPFQIVAPTAAANPAPPATTETVHWSLRWTTETRWWHTTGQPRDAGWTWSRWYKVKWNLPEHRRTEGSRTRPCGLINTHWFGVRLLLAPRYWAGLGRKQMKTIPLWSLDPNLSDSRWGQRSLKNTLWKTQQITHLVLQHQRAGQRLDCKGAYLASYNPPQPINVLMACKAHPKVPQLHRDRHCYLHVISFYRRLLFPFWRLI